MIIQIFLLIVIVYSSYWLVYELIKRKTRYFVNVKSNAKLPGDELNLLPWTSPLDQVNYDSASYSKKYGDMYFVWFWYEPVLMISNAEALKEFYRDHYEHKRDPSFSCCGSIFERLMGHALAVTWGKARLSYVRTLFGEYFTQKAADHWMPIIAKETEKWIKTVHTDVPTTLFDEGISMIPLRVLAYVLYGTDLSEERISKLKDFVAQHNKVFGYTHQWETKLPFYEHFPTKENKELTDFVSSWKKFHLDLYNEYKPTIESRVDLFSAIAPKVYAGNFELDMIEFHETLGEILLANADLTYAAIGWLLVHLAQNEDCQKLARKEVFDLFPDEIPSTSKELSQLSYMQMVANESARMKPALTLAMPERTVRDSVLNGYFVPKGTIVVADAFSVNNNPAYWKDPHSFLPERWAQSQIPVPYSYHRFGLGPRKCLGYIWGNLMNNHITAAILRNFEIQLANKNESETLKTDGIPFFTAFLPGKVILKNLKRNKQ